MLLKSGDMMFCQQVLGREVHEIYWWGKIFGEGGYGLYVKNIGYIKVFDDKVLKKVFLNGSEIECKKNSKKRSWLGDAIYWHYF